MNAVAILVGFPWVAWTTFSIPQCPYAYTLTVTSAIMSNFSKSKFINLILPGLDTIYTYPGSIKK